MVWYARTAQREPLVFCSPKTHIEGADILIYFSDLPNLASPAAH